MLDLNPLGLIGSGSLLIACREEASDDLTESIRAAGIDVGIIGEVMEEGEGVEARDEHGNIASWPHFQVDEIARLFESLAHNSRHIGTRLVN